MGAIALADIGERLAALRIARRLTQAQLAEEAGLGLRTVQRLETGSTSTNLAAFLSVCRVLGILQQVDAGIPRPAVSPIAQLKTRRKATRGASRVRAPRKSPKKKWMWGDGT